MNNWITSAESALKSLKKDLSIPYEFENWNEDKRGKLPDAYIVYFLVSNTPLSSADNKERVAVPKIQVSMFYRNIKVIQDIPQKIISAFTSNGYRRVNEGRIPFQKSTGHYGWRCDFNYLERR